MPMLQADTDSKFQPQYHFHNFPLVQETGLKTKSECSWTTQCGLIVEIDAICAVDTDRQPVMVLVSLTFDCSTVARGLDGNHCIHLDYSLFVRDLLPVATIRLSWTTPILLAISSSI